MVYIIPLWVLLWLVGIQGDIIYVNTEVDTLMASVGLDPMGPVGCVVTVDYLCLQIKHYCVYLIIHRSVYYLKVGITSRPLL